MASRKIRLSFDPSDDYRLIGITTPLPDYSLVFRINRQLHWDFKRLGTFQVHYLNEIQWFFLFAYQPDEYTEYYFTGNAHPSHWMAEPHLLIDKGAHRIDTFRNILTDCAAIEDVFLADDYSHFINSLEQTTDARRKRTADRITSILYDLEIFMMELSRQSKPSMPKAESMYERNQKQISSNSISP
ncbi:MAG TPA: IPExxxVDY family protein [Bacteroidales bacterium]|nr:MAG: hypothetical protein A2X11_00435 [Bacteroidetes bacterium GWE2_42_24]OFY27565.1 MAG: hypothetical protein A2X09_07790 [Bacteroidetes bacterium GWF2_43_11]HAQ64955.1 IPExxxVDY family protein [Bacteroidales bacterium]HBZ66089.1 IPExxxVDY family protein [Bacteroidales bacterium]